jgi:hypothetical protein
MTVVLTQNGKEINPEEVVLPPEVLKLIAELIN